MTWEELNLSDPPTNEQMLAYLTSPHWHPGPPRIENEYIVFDGEFKTHVWLESDNNSLQTIKDAFGNVIEPSRIVCHLPVLEIPERFCRG